MEEDILRELRNQDAKGEDHGLTEQQLAEKLGAEVDEVKSKLQSLQGQGKVHHSSFWWYSGPEPRGSSVDQA